MSTAVNEPTELALGIAAPAAIKVAPCCGGSKRSGSAAGAAGGDQQAWTAGGTGVFDEAGLVKQSVIRRVPSSTKLAAMTPSARAAQDIQKEVPDGL